jgi:hypothetical protein
MFLQVTQQLVIPEYATSLVQPVGLSRLSGGGVTAVLIRQFCRVNPGVLDSTAALVQLPPVGDARSPYQVPPLESA